MPQLLHCQFLPPRQKNTATPAVVLIRGLGRSSSFWLEFSSILAENCPVYLIDLLGTGQSIHNSGRTSISQLAHDVVFTLNSLSELGKFYIAGISLGGMIALECGKILSKQKEEALSQDSALQKAHATCSFQGLLVLSSSFRGSGHPRISPRGLLAALLSTGKNGLPRHGKFAKYLVAPETLAKRPELPTLWDNIWQREKFKPLPLFAQLFAAATYRLEKIEGLFPYRLLLIVSQDDKFVSWKNTLALWDRLPSAQLIVLNSLGHDLTTDNPELLAQLILRFVQEARPTLPL